MTEHPGRTAEEKHILDEVGCGKTSITIWAVEPKLREPLEKLLADGLLIQGAGDLEMPVAVHIQWCDYWSEQNEKDSKA